jgi:inorganic triphosphatase YgiF
MKDTELELQLRILEEGRFKDILQDSYLLNAGAATPKTEKYETIYFDTNDHRLQHTKYSFRIRKSDETYTATVKENASGDFGAFTRGEWSQLLTQNKPSIRTFADLPIGKTLKDIVGRKFLFPQFETRYTRTYANVTTKDKSVIELALNIGEISSPSGKEDICEIELELHAGNPSALYFLASDLSRRYPLMPEEKNKYMRGLALSGLDRACENPGASAARLLPLPNNNRKQKERPSILQILLDNIKKNQYEFKQSPDSPKTTHQLRTNVRRLRSVLYMIKPLFDQEDYQNIQTDLREYAILFSKLRELDVLTKQWKMFFSAKPDLSAVALDFLCLIDMQRKNEKNALLQKINAGISTPVFMKTKYLIEVLKETKANTKANRFFKIMEKRVLSTLKKFKDDYRSTDFRDPRAVHLLRIRCKKLNYSLGLLRSNSKKKTALQLKFKKLQKSLGRLCDINNQMRFIQELALDPHYDPYHDAFGIFTGHQSSAAVSLQKKLLHFKI